MLRGLKNKCQTNKLKNKCQTYACVKQTSVTTRWPVSGSRAERPAAAFEALLGFDAEQPTTSLRSAGQQCHQHCWTTLLIAVLDYSSTRTTRSVIRQLHCKDLPGNVASNNRRLLTLLPSCNFMASTFVQMRCHRAAVRLIVFLAKLMSWFVTTRWPASGSRAERPAAAFEQTEKALSDRTRGASKQADACSLSPQPGC